MDHHSTTPCDPRVVEKMLPFFSSLFANPASITHAPGRDAAKAVENSRIEIAALTGCDRGEVFFTSGATESNNTVFSGVEFSPGDRVLISAIEHKSVSAPASRLKARGIDVEVLPVDRDGIVAPHTVEEAITPRTRLVSVIAASGDIGTIQPLEQIAAICRERGLLFHTDATQAVGRVPFDFRSIGCDLASFSGHKMYGPKGCGVLLVRRGVRLQPLLVGGGQEKGFRAGTTNVPAIVGTAEALRICVEEQPDERPRLTMMRERLAELIFGSIPASSLNGSSGLRLPGNLNVTFRGVDAEALILAMRNFALSAGSACSSGDREPSQVLLAIGCSELDALSSIRFGLGRSNTVEHIEKLAVELQAAIARLREISTP